jgi:hypothetical protein
MEVTEDCRNVHTKELHELYSSPDIVWVIKRRTRRAGHIERIRAKKNVHKV